MASRAAMGRPSEKEGSTKALAAWSTAAFSAANTGPSTSRRFSSIARLGGRHPLGEGTAIAVAHQGQPPAGALGGSGGGLPGGQQGIETLLGVEAAEEEQHGLAGRHHPGPGGRRQARRQRGGQLHAVGDHGDGNLGQEGADGGGLGGAEGMEAAGRTQGTPLPQPPHQLLAAAGDGQGAGIEHAVGGDHQGQAGGGQAGSDPGGAAPEAVEMEEMGGERLAALNRERSRWWGGIDRR